MNQVLKSFLINWELLSAVLVSILIFFLGFISYLRNRKSITNKFFFLYCILVSIWGIANVFIFRVDTPLLFLLLLRSILLIAVWINFFIYWITKIFPKEEFSPKKLEFFLTIFFSVLTSFIVVSPLTFQNVKIFTLNERDVTTGIGIAFFGLLATFFNIKSFFHLILNIRQNPQEKFKYSLLLFGLLLTSVLVITFNYVLPNVSNIKKYIEFASLYQLPFIITLLFGAYAFEIFNIRMISAVIFVIILLLSNFFQLIQDHNNEQLILQIGIFFFSFLFSLFLVRSVYVEVEQKEYLAKLNQQLDRLNKLKSEFLSIASHQIRSPMIVTRGFIDLLLDDQYGQIPEQAKEVLRKIDRRLDEEINLINNLLDLRRIEENRMEYEFINFDIDEILKDLCDFYNLRAKEKGLELRCNLLNSPLIIKGDKEKLKQVFNNLIDNAIKYTDKGYVEINLQEKDNKVLVSVKDTGRGIAPDKLESIFQEFTRDEEIKKTPIVGSGLGLYIAKNIIQAHNGKIWAESEGIGKGSVFYVELEKS